MKRNIAKKDEVKQPVPTIGEILNRPPAVKRTTYEQLKVNTEGSMDVFLMLIIIFFGLMISGLIFVAFVFYFIIQRD